MVLDRGEAEISTKDNLNEQKWNNWSVIPNWKVVLVLKHTI